MLTVKYFTAPGFFLQPAAWTIYLKATMTYAHACILLAFHCTKLEKNVLRSFFLFVFHNDETIEDKVILWSEQLFKEMCLLVVYCFS